MSASQESPNSLKRDHDSFALDDLGDLKKPFTADSKFMKAYESQPQDAEEQESSIPTPPVSVEANKRAASPTQSRRSSTSSLSDVGSMTPSVRHGSPMHTSFAPMQASPSKSAFAVMNGTEAPPPKRAKLTFAEKEAKRIEKEFRDQERAAEKSKKEAERQAHAEIKARKDAEKEAERKKKEAEKEAERKKKEAEKEEKRLVQEAEKAAKEERKRLKEEGKRLKDEEKQKAEEERKKKERSQKKLNSFFAIPATTASSTSVEGRKSMSPAPSNPGLAVATASPRALTPGKPKPSAFDKLFPAFFVQPNVTMAPINRFERDEEASEALEKLIDSYILENRSPGCLRTFDAMSMFHLSGHNNVARGKSFVSVREIMTEFSGNATRPIDLTTDSQNTQIKRTSALLEKIPMKFLQFQEDVRPPYRGTYTKRPINGIMRLARNPLRRDLPDTNYDYDSEAEWVEDEDGEDLNSGGEEEEECGEDADDMDGFLDDSGEDAAQSRRLLLQGDLEHSSTGLCWEDRHKRSTNVKMMPYRMEVIVDPKLKAIDPLATHYWQSTPCKSMEPPRVPLNNLKPNSSSMNSNKPIKPFFTPASDFAKPDSDSTQNQPLRASASSKPEKPKKLLPKEDMQTFNDAVRGNDLSKVGLIEVLKKKFPGRTGGQVKATLETFARRVGQKEADKRWVLIEEVGGAGS